MCNGVVDQAFKELYALSRKKGYLVLNDIEKLSVELSANQVDWLTDRLLTSGIEIFDVEPEIVRNGTWENQFVEKGLLTDTLFFLKYKGLHATGKRIRPKGFIVYKGSKYNLFSTSSCTSSIENKRQQLIRLGKMENGVLTEDIQFGSPSTAAKVLIGNSVNGKIVWVDSHGNTLKQILAEGKEIE